MGEEGWLEHELERGGSRRRAERRGGAAPRLIPAESLPRAIAAAGKALQSIDGDDVASLIDDVGDARVVLIGEASHGTSEFYRARAAITRRLIEQARLQRRRRRGGLAGRHPHRPLCPPSRAGRRHRAGLLALSHLDVAERGGAGLRRMAARLECRPAGGGARLLPRPRPLRPVRVDRRGHRLPREGRSRRRRGWRANATAA